MPDLSNEGKSGGIYRYKVLLQLGRQTERLRVKTARSLFARINNIYYLFFTIIEQRVLKSTFLR
jgi:hypothetical protein